MNKIYIWTEVGDDKSISVRLKYPNLPLKGLETILLMCRLQDNDTKSTRYYRGFGRLLEEDFDFRPPGRSLKTVSLGEIITFQNITSILFGANFKSTNKARFQKNKEIIKTIVREWMSAGDEDFKERAQEVLKELYDAGVFGDAIRFMK